MAVKAKLKLALEIDYEVLYGADPSSPDLIERAMDQCALDVRMLLDKELNVSDWPDSNIKVLSATYELGEIVCPEST